MNIREASLTYDKVIGNFERAVKELTETGIVELSMPKRPAEYNTKYRAYWKLVDGQWPIGVVFVRKTIRRIARELKRPVVIAEYKPWTKGFIVTMKQRKTLAPLVANFLLLESSDTRAWIEGPGGIAFRRDKTNWYVRFETSEHFKEWKTFVLGSETCRKALKLPDLPAEAIPSQQAA